MADMSLDEIIAKKKGLKMFKVQFTNRSGKPAQKFAPRIGQQGVDKNHSLANRGAAMASSNQRATPKRTGDTGHTGPAKGQIDARDTITIKNRIRMSDARMKILQKRISQQTFDARSKLQPRSLSQGMRRHEDGMQALVPQQQLGFQNVPQTVSSSPRQQRFQISPSSFSPTSGCLQVYDQKTSNNLLNFTVAVNPSVPSSNDSRPVGPLTRTLQNPLANGGSLVENTGNSLKITRAIPDVIFDGQNLTVTRRLRQNSKKQGSASGSVPHARLDSDRGPVIQFQNDKFQPTSVRAPPPTNPIKSRQTASQSGQKARASSPIQPPSSAKRPAKASRAEEGAVKTSLGYRTETRYKTTKNTLVNKMPEPEPEPEDRLRGSPSPSGSVSTLPSKRPFQLGTSSSPHQTHSVPTSTKSSKSGQPVSKRLAPRPSAQSQNMGEQRGSGSSKASKRRAPMSLSERFAARETGSSSPVIVDHVPPKKRRDPEPEPDKEDLEEDSEVKEQSEEEEEPETPLISPLQGFRMLVTNLHATVTQDDIIELFGAIGPLKRANILSKGQAEVAYIHREHAVLALKKYHNRELDGQPMFVKVTTPLNAKVMKPVASDDNNPGLPPALRSSKKPASSTPSAPVEIPLIHKALFKTGVDSMPAKSVRFTVKL
ncbi:hypothetical protein ACOMHN_062163 [Nucella lapillus]